MTATPRIYNDETKSQAEENDATLCSMDDESIFGKEFHRLGFSEAVSGDLLSDYKVLVLAVDEKYINSTFQKQLADKNNVIKLDDAVRITGCWNGLSKRMSRDEYSQDIAADPVPMRRAVAFSRSIDDSKRFTDLFSEIIKEYRKNHSDEDNWLECEVAHVDGTFNALQRNSKLDWLKAETAPESNVCRILSNARCLSEGVDVPALDAVMFLNPRNSVVDVVQSVGRVMRKAPGKKYGYIILPIGIPSNIKPDEALKNNQNYKVVWQVLQALRAHDDRFNATVNKIALNDKRPDQIQVIGVGFDKSGSGEGTTGDGMVRELQTSLNLPVIEEWRNAIYAKIVLKCGDRQYWENWARDVAVISDRHIARINALLAEADPTHRLAFNKFLESLRANLNPSISQEDAVEMLSQHLITKPVFDALFADYEFTQHNPVSIAMQSMLDLLEKQSLEKETASLEKFYDSVRDKASGIDNAKGKQEIIRELYEKFFKIAFPRTAESLGIVYTPVPIVDFIINSADFALRREFGLGLTDEEVHILDPFTGTGTFIVRLLQSGHIKPEDLQRKYKAEIHANEILLLAYYIAAINIEAAYHQLSDGEYQPFQGIVLTDTFQMSENDGSMKETLFPENNLRVTQQKARQIRVILANPPYSAKQDNENDSNKNLVYPGLDSRIRNTYAQYSNATNKQSLYDPYIRSFRWASDRIQNTGIICYVTNGAFVDNNAMDGLRKSLEEEFTAIYCFNLRGDARTSGEQRRMEKGNVFGAGSRASIAITLLVKKPSKNEKCRIYYHDIGDYLTREEKLKIIAEFNSINSIPWRELSPNSSHDWINQRDPAFAKFMPLGDKKSAEDLNQVFSTYSIGVKTNRDIWAYNFSYEGLKNNMARMVAFYNQQAHNYKAACLNKTPDTCPDVEQFVDNDPQKISWNRSLKNDLSHFITHDFRQDDLVKGVYRPFCKQWVYFNRSFNDMVYQMPRVFPNTSMKNLGICVPGIGTNKEFSCLIVDTLPDVQIQSNGQCFPFFIFEKLEHRDGQFPSLSIKSEYVKKEAISDLTLTTFRETYDPRISKEDIFYYVYGILHSPEYKRRFEADLKKMLPRIPFAGDFWAFSKAGRDLAEWHLNYESVEPCDLDEFSKLLGLSPKDDYRVTKMVFAKNNKEVDRTTIIYNANIKLSGIPLEAYDYVVNGKSALEWVMERYQFTRDRDSQIANDPNEWSENPRYILDLVKRIVRVSVETMNIVKSLPPLNERTNSG